MPLRHAPLVDSVIIGVLRAIITRPGVPAPITGGKSTLLHPLSNTPHFVPARTPRPLFGLKKPALGTQLHSRLHSTQAASSSKQHASIGTHSATASQASNGTKNRNEASKLKKLQRNGYSRHQLKQRLGPSLYNKAKKSVLFQRFFEKGTVDKLPKASDQVYFTRYKRPKELASTTANINRHLRQLVLFDGRINAATKFLREVEIRQKKDNTEGPDLKSYTMIVQGFGRAGNMKSAVSWFRRMLAREIKPDVNVYTTLIDGFMRISDVDKAEKYFAEMMDSNIQPNLVTYNCMMYHATQQLDMATTEAIFARLMAAKLQPDPFTFAILINGYGRHNNVDEAWRLMQLMEKKYSTISPVIATTIMAMYRKHNDHAGVRKLYSDFFQASKDTPASEQKQTMEPTAHTHNVLLNAILAESDIGMVHHYYNHFLKTLISAKHSARPSSKANDQSSLSNAYNFTTFMRSFLRHDDYNAVIGVYNDMLKHQVKPTIVTYGTLMLAHAFVPDPETCTRIHKELERTTFLKPNVVTYTILLRAWAKVGNWDMVEQVYQEMRTRNIEPNKETLSVIRRWKNSPSEHGDSIQEGLRSEQ
ncbi:hypothetical protein VKS41_005972 [Umbelopsis sp. WA50703]